MAVDRTASTGSSSSSSTRSASLTSTRSLSPNRSLAAVTIDAEESTAITLPRGRRSASICVTFPEPHPASRTVSSPASCRRSSTCWPKPCWIVETRS